jgi:hypothetical protein
VKLLSSVLALTALTPRVLDASLPFAALAAPGGEAASSEEPLDCSRLFRFLRRSSLRRIVDPSALAESVEFSKGGGGEGDPTPNPLRGDGDASCDMGDALTLSPTAGAVAAGNSLILCDRFLGFFALSPAVPLVPFSVGPGDAESSGGARLNDSIPGS